MNKVDFLVVLSVKNANPNGDPLNGNRPREDIFGKGEISDVCIKRKIRNRMQMLGENIFVQTQGEEEDGYSCLKERFEGEILKTLENKEDKKNPQLLKELACKKWLDVRSFGQLFAFKGNNDKGQSIGVRGAVSISPAFSITPIDITTTQITKSVNSEPGDQKGSDTIGTKHRVDFGIYTFTGSINSHFAKKTGLTESDVSILKKTIETLFENDMSSARPEGSMIVEKVYWWTHDSEHGNVPSAKLYNSVEIQLKDELKPLASMDDVIINHNPPEGVNLEITQF